MVKTIIFDLGNVIVFVDHKRIIENLAKHSSLDKEGIEEFFKQSKARRDFEKGKVSEQQFFENFKDNLDLRLDFHMFRKIWCSCFTGPNNELEKIIYKLKKKYRLILLSNTDKIHFEYIFKKCKLLEIFDDYVLSYKAGYRKPNPMIFIKAIKKAKAAPSQIVFIDDIYLFAAAAKMLGIHGIQYKTIRDLKNNLAARGVLV